jgi:hypothetical protein
MKTPRWAVITMIGQLIVIVFLIGFIIERSGSVDGGVVTGSSGPYIISSLTPNSGAVFTIQAFRIEGGVCTFTTEWHGKNNQMILSPPFLIQQKLDLN